jgi:hypothetical protein
MSTAVHDGQRLYKVAGGGVDWRQVKPSSCERGEPMTSTKLMLLGILIMLAGLAVDSVIVRELALRNSGIDAANSLGNIELAVFAVGFVIGLIGFFRR